MHYLGSSPDATPWSIVQSQELFSTATWVPLRSSFLFGIVRAIYNFQLDEMAQSGKPVLSQWLVKWNKVAPQKSLQQALPHFTVTQMAAIVNKAKTQMYRSLFALAAGTGARAGELFALRVETDVDFDEQTITIRRSVFEGEENTSKTDTGTKTEPERCRLTPP